MPTEHDAARSKPAEAPYSTLAHYGAAAFGGPLAVLAFTALSAQRIGKLESFRAWLVPLSLVIAALTLWLGMRSVAPEDPLAALSTLSLHRLSMLNRMAGIALFAALHLAIGGALRAARSGPPPSPWVPGLGCVLGGQLASAALFKLGAVLGS